LRDDLKRKTRPTTQYKRQGHNVLKLFSSAKLSLIAFVQPRIVKKLAKRCLRIHF